MSRADYDHLYADDCGDRYFIAELPGLAQFGKRFDEIVERANEATMEDFEKPEIQQRLADGIEKLGDKLDDARARLSKLAQSDPEQFEAAQAAFEQWEGGLATYGSGAWDAEEDDGNVDDDDDDDEELPAGQYRVDCGSVSKVNAHQRRLFEWLLANQWAVCDQVRENVYRYYESVYADYRKTLDGLACAELLVPKVGSSKELDDRIRLTGVALHGKAWEIGLSFDCTWDDEHGLGVLIRNQKVVEVGYGETAILD